MLSLYTNSSRAGPAGTREEEEDDDYENSAPPYKDLPPKPSSFAPPRPPRTGSRLETPALPCKRSQLTGLDLSPAPCLSPQLGVQLELSSPHPPTATPAVSCLSLKRGAPACCPEKKLVLSVCLLAALSLLLSCVGLTVSLIQYHKIADRLRSLTLEQLAWQANVTGVAGLAGLRIDVDRVRADTNRSLVELQGLLDCTRVACPEGWLPFDGKCYYFSPNTKTWDGALVFCQENFAHLVIINSKAEQEFVSKVDDSPRVYWLGLSDRKQEGDWRWLDGSPLTISFWGLDEPNNSHGEDCASMNRDGSWNDISCFKNTYWICERKCTC
ncbi:C-type lectin domain family 17, member A [Ochotona curzoniae]|uniref:C-type lectin domain family 17, member A n=1 Tax=Ochotona curzoniae TaxID=130825 RepID=UPI001B3479C6|nr:C-type lectin domain family 17, member A [Ochotona curzoniae]